ncbi:MAG: SpoIIE family protein phosphatase [Lachnospiraceae bacterium]|nr:SpoIIE family protein phosphatase [Lachnospiraceae bacterium]
MRAIQLRGFNDFTAVFSKSTYRTAVLQAVYFLCGAVVSHGAVFGSYAPFGASFCASVPFGGALSATLGSIVGYVLLYPHGSFRYVATVVTIFALRWMLNDLDRLAASKIFAPLVAMVPLVCTGGVMVAVSYNGSMDIIMCMIEALLAAVGAYFFTETITLSAGSRGLTTYNQQEIACIVMTGCIFLLSANSLTLSGISLGRILAVTAVLFCAYYGSVAGGSIGGAATGIVFGIGGREFDFITACYCFGGLMAGLFSYVGRVGTVVAFTVCSGIVSLRNGVTGEAACVFYETIIASLIFLFVPKDIGNRISSFVTPHTDTANSEGLRRSVIMRLDFASTALRSISQAVNAVSEKMKEYYSDNIQNVYTRAVDENCARCGMRAFCWQNEKEKKEERFESLTPVLESVGEISDSQVKEIFSGKCCKSGEMAYAINKYYDSYRSFLAAEARVSQVRGVVAGQFSGLGDILGELKTEFESFESYDIAAAERVCASLKANGFVPIECSCRIDRLGRMTVELEVADNDRKLLKKGTMLKEVSRMSGRRLQPPQVTALGNRCRAIFTEKPKYDVQVGTAQHICGNGTLCGDSFNYFNDGQGRLIVIISDGMGTGGRAAVDASMAVSIMSKLTKVGLGYDCSLSVTNSALMVKSRDESLATVDMLSLDLFSGNAELMKAGAPVTFVRKSGKVIRVEPTSLPAGILTDVKFSHDDVELDEGDIIVMVSDGAVCVSDGWIGAMIRDFEGDEIQELVNDIIDEAAIGSRLGRDDDITVVGVRVI